MTRDLIRGFIASFTVIASSLICAQQHFYGNGYTIIAAEHSGDDLAVIVAKKLPAGNVENALQTLLAGTGWQLADGYAADPMIFRLYSQTLPDQKQQIGPMPLNEALVWIGGPAWRLVVDPVNKLVSYEVKTPYRQSRRILPVPNTTGSGDADLALTAAPSVITAEPQTYAYSSTLTQGAVSAAPSPVAASADPLRIFIPPKTAVQTAVAKGAKK